MDRIVELKANAQSKSPIQLWTALGLKHWDWLLVAVLFSLAFRRLLNALPNLWFEADSYYAHGPFVPICALLILLERWPKLRGLPQQGVGWMLVAIPPLLWLEWITSRTRLYDLQSVLALLTLATCILVLGGRKWLKGLAAPLSFLAFGLPVFDGLVDANTALAQTLSTDVSVWMLRAFGMNPLREGNSIVSMSHYVMDVGAPCSGMKLFLAVATFSTFFALVAGLSRWRNAILIASVLPLTFAVNSLRIALVGVVGNTWGSSAGNQFHDYSGYLSLGLCFGLQYGLTKVMGWK